VSTEIKRLHLGTLTQPWGRREKWPVHGFVVTHPGGAVLVDTGIGGPERELNHWGAVNVTMADALAELDMSPADISLVINTHLHFDHCGQNAVFQHAPFYVQRAELDRARREEPEQVAWFDFMGARFELLDGDAEIVPGVSVVATPGHTAGHQSVTVQVGDGQPDLLIGDAAYAAYQFTGPLDQKLPPGQADDRPAWEASVTRVRAMTPARVHFCHDTSVVRA
jgi:N-acyl homoserine lactone hydrolase